MRSKHLIFACMCSLGVVRGLYAQASDVPATAPTGRLLVESDLLAWSEERHTQEKDGYHSWTLNHGDILLSTGVGQCFDLEAGFTGWLHERSGLPDDECSRNQTGLACVRAKWAFYGEDGKNTALALLPYFYRPVKGGGKTTHGLMVPWSTPVCEGLFVGGQLGLERSESDTGTWRRDFLGSFYACKNLGASWICYLETYGNMAWNHPRVSNFSIGPGLIWSVTETFSLDFACYTGIGRKATDMSAVLRVSWCL